MRRRCSLQVAQASNEESFNQFERIMNRPMKEARNATAWPSTMAATCSPRGVDRIPIPPIRRRTLRNYGYMKNDCCGDSDSDDSVRREAEDTRNRRELFELMACQVDEDGERSEYGPAYPHLRKPGGSSVTPSSGTDIDSIHRLKLRIDLPPSMPKRRTIVVDASDVAPDVKRTGEDPCCSIDGSDSDDPEGGLEGAASSATSACRCDMPSLVSFSTCKPHHLDSSGESMSVCTLTSHASSVSSFDQLDGEFSGCHL